MVFVLLGCLLNGLYLLASGTHLNLRPVGNAALKTTLRPHVTRSAVLTARDLAIVQSNAISQHSVASLSDSHETSSCPFVYYSSNVTCAKPAEMSCSGAARNGTLGNVARKAEEEHSRAKREEERVRCEKRARKEKELERDRK